MKQYLFIIFLFFIVIFLFADSAWANHNRPNCLGMYGTVQGVNYAGGQIKVSCGGDTGPSGCIGSSVMLSPGQSFHFDNCSCPPYTDGCLKVENVPWLCSAGYDMACGTNGQVLKKDITLSCLAPASPTPRAPTRTPTAASTRTPTPRPRVPTATPISTRTPTPRPRVPTATPTPQATPTPGFSKVMCKCDGIDATPIFPGANVAFSAFAKVFGTDTNLATIKDITFSVYESLQNDPNNATLLKKSNPISSQIISQDSLAVRYKSTWNFTFPAAVNTSSLYRVIAQINCVKKVAMAPQNVLAAETVQQPSWIQAIFAAIGRPFDLIAGLFGGGGSSEQSAQTPTPTQTASQRKTLQLLTIHPAKMLEKSCSLIKFQFNNQ